MINAATAPPAWRTAPLKHCVGLRNEHANRSEEAGRYIALENMKSWTGQLIHSDSAVDTDDAGVRFEAGDVLFGKLRPYLAKAHRAREAGTCSAEILVLRPRRLHPQYLLYWLISPAWISLIDSSTYGSKMPRASWDFIGCQYVPVPPVETQDAIADFLDRETEKIDALVAKKQRLIELLREKRTALISHAVTKGLDPDVPMKDSGVEWLGRIPAAWQMRRLKQVTEFVTSGSRGWAEYYSDDGPVFIRITNLNRKSIDLDLSQIQHVRPPAGSEGERTRVTSGDVLVSITADIGSVGLVPDGLGEAYVNQHTALTRPRKHLVEPRWLALCLHSSVGQRQFPILLQGGTKVGLNLDDVRNLLVVLPPLTEQKWLLSAVDDNAKKLADLSASVQAATARLLEYRSALITSAVTGQIDVGER